MKIWKLSLGTSYFSKETCELMKQKGIVSVYPDTASKGQSSKTQGDAFLEAQAYDLFYVCRSNESIEYIGMFIDNRPLFSLVDGHNDWVDREFLLIKDAINPNNYSKTHDRWWSPKNNSTFIEINPEHYNEFEKEFLIPVFNSSIKEIKVLRNKRISSLTLNLSKVVDLQKKFFELSNNKTTLFKELNQLDELELKNLIMNLKEEAEELKNNLLFG